MRNCLPLALGATIALGACGSVTEGKRVEYTKTVTLPALEVPPDLTAPASDSRYAVPDSVGTSAATLSGYRQQTDRGAAQAKTVAAGAVPPSAKLRVERAGSQRWLYVAESADTLWPIVKEFWQSNGLPVQLEQRELGVMETEWVENRAKVPFTGFRSLFARALGQTYTVPELDKYRTRFERSADGLGTEIYISYRGIVELYIREGQPETKWQPKPGDPDLEAEFLTRLMMRLGAPAEAARAAVAGTPAEPRAQIVKGAEGEVLEVREPFDRAWRRIGLVLDRGGFVVEDRDRQKGLYFVRYADAAAEADKKAREGVLGRLAFWRSDDKAKAEQYQVEVRSEGEGSRVRVLDKAGGAETSGTGSRILALLLEQIK